MGSTHRPNPCGHHKLHARYCTGFPFLTKLYTLRIFAFSSCRSLAFASVTHLSHTAATSSVDLI
ncbi:unnamed protein product [Citrullus colocynthis]|uniref:Uncharacterized protein n=1 Tax=Citrullus colocynthis TaxID=252529 RepID=A0ABP0XUR0_9ROSI